MAHPSRRTATAPDFCRRGLRRVEYEAFREDGVIASIEQRDQTRLERRCLLAAATARIPTGIAIEDTLGSTAH